jgi:ABC-2 type transport system ATP-binding protein
MARIMHDSTTEPDAGGPDTGPDTGSDTAVADRPDTPDAPVTTDGLARRFDDVTVIKDLSMSFAAGEVHGLIGPSGSGKTTTVRMLLGILPPSEGQVRVFGRDPRELGTAERKRLGYMPQMGVLYPELTIRDNLRFIGSLHGVRKVRGRIDEVLELLDMGGTQDLRLDQASGGMQRRVALAGVLLHEPTLLFLDEPTAGLDPVLRRRVWDHLRDLRDDGCTIIVTTQIVSEATSCDSVDLLAEGEVLAGGRPEELRRLADGGDVLLLHAAERIEPVTLDAVLAHELVHSADVPPGDGLVLRVVVDDADAAMGSLEQMLAERGIELRLTERPVTDFDDVFVALMERSDG